MIDNCYNCKHKKIYLTNALQGCKKQHAWIRAPRKSCPKFEGSFKFKIFGDQSPFLRTEKLVGGCEE